MGSNWERSSNGRLVDDAVSRHCIIGGVSSVDKVRQHLPLDAVELPDDRSMRSTTREFCPLST